MVCFSPGFLSTPRGLVVLPVLSASPDVTVQPAVLVDEGIPTVYYVNRSGLRTDGGLHFIVTVLLPGRVPELVRTWTYV